MFHPPTTTQADEAVYALRRAITMRWFRAPEILERIDLWHTALVEAFAAVFEGDPHRTVALPSEEGCDAADTVLGAFNDWLGRDIIWAIIEDIEFGDDYSTAEGDDQ